MDCVSNAAREGRGGSAGTGRGSSINATAGAGPVAGVGGSGVWSVARALATGAMFAVPAALGVVLAAGTMFAARPTTAALPPVPVPPENPVTEAKRVLGKVLFWDEQLSANNAVACATCHQPARAGNDPRIAVNPGPDGVTGNGDDRRGSPGVPRSDADRDFLRDAIFRTGPQVTDRAANSPINAAFATDLFWDGRARTQFRDPLTNAVLVSANGALESQAVGPPLSGVEMGHDGIDWSDVTARLSLVRPLELATAHPPDVAAALTGVSSYGELFQRAFGDDSITPSRIAFAIATYQRTLISDQTPWDRTDQGLPGGLTAAQQRGLNVFNNGNCNACHSTPLFTGNGFRNIGLRPETEDRGRQNVTNNPADAGRFKTPGLRNVALKATFMHNGQFTSLQQVLGFYRGARNGPLPGVTNRDPVMNTVTVPPPGSPGEADLIEFLVNGLRDARVATLQFPFDKPTLATERPADLASSVANGSTGTGGIVPAALADMPPMLGTEGFRVGVTNALGGATATLGMSLVAPAAGRINPTRILAKVVTSGAGPGDGLATAQFDLSPLFFSGGQPVFVQWFIEDPSGLLGVATSNVLRLPVFCGSYGCPPPCWADFDGNTSVNDDDLSGFVTAYFEVLPGPGGFTLGPCDGAEAPMDSLGYRADITGDCSLNDDDLSLFVTRYFLGCN